MQSVPLCMDYLIDFDPTHRVIRLTVTKPLTDESLTDVYRSLSHVAAKGGPYGSILDLSQVENSSLSTDTIQALASTAPAVPVGRPRVVVARAPALYGLCRMFELLRDSMGGQFHVVHELGEAYDLLKVTAEDFTQRLIPEDLAA
jgi:hypothetical protein